MRDNVLNSKLTATYDALDRLVTARTAVYSSTRAELAPMSPGKLLYRCMRMLFLYYIQQKGYKEGQFGFYTALFRGPIYTIIEQVKRWERVEKKRRGDDS